MTPQVFAALGSRWVLLAGLIRISLPSYTIRLLDGAGVVTWGAETFTGRDPVYGTIGEVEALNEQVGDSIPGLEIMLLPPSTSAAVSLATANQQGAAVRVYLAVVDAATGAVLPEPELLFAGEIDTATLEVNRGERSLSLSIASVWDRLFEPNEGARLSDAFHRSIWPSEFGLSNMSGTPITKLWGPGDKPPAATLAPALPTGGVQRFF